MSLRGHGVPEEYVRWVQLLYRNSRVHSEALKAVSSDSTAPPPEKSIPVTRTRKRGTQQLTEATAGDEQDVPSASTAPPPEKSIPVTRTRKRGTQQLTEATAGDEQDVPSASTAPSPEKSIPITGTRKRGIQQLTEATAGDEQDFPSASTAPPPEKSIPVTRTRKRGTQQLTKATAGDEQVVSSAATAQVPEKSTPPIKTRKQATQQLNEAVAGDEQDVPSDSTAPPPEKSIPGGPRAMHQSYQDAMAIVAKYGKPDYFLTFTCNPQWREIVDNLYPGQNSSDRPDLVARVFHESWQESTDVDIDGYPKCKRPNNGRTVVIGGETFDNQHVVPYNRYLLLLLNAHINVEVCGYIQAVKYLYEYVYKGPDRASLRLLQRNVSGQINEILAFLDARYVCAPEAVHHIFKFECQLKSDSVCRLQVHLPDFQTVTFLAGEEQEALTAAAHKDTTLTAWFKLNREYEQKEQNGVDLRGTVDPRTLYYSQIPEFFFF
ncbi:hypothetical protein Aduo_001880 [Ancylostoma duodenale]